MVQKYIALKAVMNGLQKYLVRVAGLVH